MYLRNFLLLPAVQSSNVLDEKLQNYLKKWSSPLIALEHRNVFQMDTENVLGFVYYQDCSYMHFK